jgi:ubiquinone/menaquinone biosynthesis C-methylase UbiE
MEVEIQTIEKKENSGNSACGCGSGGCGSKSDSRKKEESDCETPSKFQLLHEGDRVVEFGSGIGRDSVAMAAAVGPSGKVIGIDKSEQNIVAARKYLDSLTVANVEFRQGDIEAVPLQNEYADVIYSTCVFNLQSNKQKVADEMYRICNHNGLVCISDFVTINPIPEELRKEASEIAGCIAGAEDVETFMNYFRKTGFNSGGIVEVNKVKLPDELLEKYLNSEMIEKYNNIDSDDGIFSVVLVVEKPETCTTETCCGNPDKHKN